eukprot:jgi/Chrzof1/2856/Cz12g01120.t1
MAAIASQIVLFGFSLYKAALEFSSLGTATAGGFTSPVSVYSALALALAAAGPNSPTHSEMLKVMLPSTNVTDTAAAETDLNQQLTTLQTQLRAAAGNGSELLLANGLWVAKSLGIKSAFQAGFADSLMHTFQAPVREVSSVTEINDWAAEATKGLITKAIPEGTPFDFVLTNTLYFKGLWEYPFKIESTLNKPFTTDTNEVVQVPMMRKLFKSSEALQYTAVEGSYQAVRLPYRGGKFSAIAILPDQSRSDLGAFLGADVDLTFLLAPGSWQRPKGGQIDVSLPKFKIQTQTSLAKALSHLGMKAAFTPAANFSHGLTQPWHISDVIHMVVVEVDETGTEAAATTAVVMRNAALVGQRPLQLIFDRPFLLLVVHDDSQLPIFLGKVKDPSAA